MSLDYCKTHNHAWSTRHQDGCLFCLAERAKDAADRKESAAAGPYEPPLVYDANQGKMVKPGAREPAADLPTPITDEAQANYGDHYHLFGFDIKEVFWRMRALEREAADLRGQLEDKKLAVSELMKLMQETTDDWTTAEADARELWSIAEMAGKYAAIEKHRAKYGSKT